jgi:eukaryotic-like serine/threonine-protein kinase
MTATRFVYGNGKYEVHDLLGRGGMANVYLGRQVSTRGFSRMVALKHLHAGLFENARTLAILMDEAKLTSRIRHPAIVNVTDVAEHDGQLYLVMDLVQGENLAELLAASAQHKRLLSAAVVVAVMSMVLRGLHAAHEATDTRGNTLELVHRDVTPQNIMVGTDGFARLLDFGIARARGRSQQTQAGVVKGKLAYMAPEYVAGLPIDRRGDVFSAGVVAWEAFCGRRLYTSTQAEQLFKEVAQCRFQPLTQLVSSLPQALDGVLRKALAREPTNRFRSALEFAQALEQAVTPAAPEAVSLLVSLLAKERLALFSEDLRRIESAPLRGATTAEVPEAPSAYPSPSRQSESREPSPHVTEPEMRSPAVLTHDTAAHVPQAEGQPERPLPLSSRLAWSRLRPLFVAALIGAVLALILGAFLQPPPPPPPFRVIPP